MLSVVRGVALGLSAFLLVASGGLFLEGGAPPGALMDIVDYSDTFTVAEWGGVPERTDGSYNTGRPAYDVENCHGNPIATWTPQ